MSGFVKLDCGILDSSLWMEPSDVCKVFITMLAMCEPDGMCRATAPGIARRANLSLDIVREALSRLEAPDPDSRTVTNQGRRIKRVDGGFLVLNYTSYRRRDYTATERKRRQREREHQAPVLPPDPPQRTDTDADADAYAYESQSVTTVTRDTTASSSTMDESTGQPIARKETNKRLRRSDIPPEIEAAACRFVEAFNGAFDRRATLTPDVRRGFARQVEAGYTPEQLVCIPILTRAGDLNPDIRRNVQIGWLLRDGSGSYERDGVRHQTKNWIGDALQSADRTVIRPKLREVAEKVGGVLETLRELGVTIAEED